MKKTMAILLVMLMAAVMLMGCNGNKGGEKVDLIAIEKRIVDLETQNKQQSDKIEELEKLAYAQYDWDNPIIITDVEAFAELYYTKRDAFIQQYFNKVVQMTCTVYRIIGGIIDSNGNLAIDTKPYPDNNPIRFSHISLGNDFDGKIVIITGVYNQLSYVLYLSDCRIVEV